MDYNKLAEGFNLSHIELSGVYKVEVPKGSVAKGHHTMAQNCGIVIPISGRAHYNIDKTNYELERGNILFAGSSMPLDKTVLGDKPWIYFLVHYKVTNCEVSPVNFMAQHFELKICEKNTMRLLSRLQELSQVASEMTGMSRLKMGNLLRQLIQEILEYSMCYSWDSEADKVNQTESYIKSHYSEELTMSQLADRIGWDQKKLNYAFTKQVGISPKKYLIQYRIDRAKSLLANENFQIGDVALQVGYEDPFLFSRMFKKYTTLSPSQFRMSLGKSP